jgi:hypothetical protein
MGTSLNGLTPAGTYPGLIKTGDNAPIDGTLKTLSDGNGNNLPMAVSTTAVNFTNQLQQSGVAVPTASQVAAKQDTLVSGTNIKTINGTSVLGSGNIAVVTSPSGVAGAIQFSNGSAFASDAANLFWDDTNNRLGIGTNSPTSKMQIVTDDATNPQAFSNQTSVLAGTASQGALISAFSSTNGGFINALWPGNAWFKMNYGGTNHSFSVGGTVTAVIDTNTTFGNGATSLGARVGIKGSGSTSATTSLLVQNSAGNSALQIKDDTFVSFPSNSPNYQVMIGGQTGTNKNGLSIGYTISGVVFSQGGLFCNPNTATNELYGNNNSILSFKDGEILIKNANNGAAISNPSAILTIDSTTKGFLPPVMTTTQKNAIATPAAGLVVYDSTTNKLCCYNGSTWNDLF